MIIFDVFSGLFLSGSAFLILLFAYGAIKFGARDVWNCFSFHERLWAMSTIVLGVYLGIGCLFINGRI